MDKYFKHKKVKKDLQVKRKRADVQSNLEYIIANMLDDTRCPCLEIAQAMFYQLNHGCLHNLPDELLY